eukprot:364996-Chlamydomonas_euryale.AAC.6
MGQSCPRAGHLGCHGAVGGDRPDGGAAVAPSRLSRKRTGRLSLGLSARPSRLPPPARPPVRTVMAVATTTVRVAAATSTTATKSASRGQPTRRRR